MTFSVHKDLIDGEVKIDNNQTYGLRNHSVILHWLVTGHKILGEERVVYMLFE